MDGDKSGTLTRTKSSNPVEVMFLEARAGEDTSIKASPAEVREAKDLMVRMK